MTRYRVEYPSGRVVYARGNLEIEMCPAGPTAIITRGRRVELVCDPRAMVTRRDGDNYQTVCCFNPRDFPLSTFSDAMASWLVKNPEWGNTAPKGCDADRDRALDVVHVVGSDAPRQEVKLHL